MLPSSCSPPPLMPGLVPTLLLRHGGEKAQILATRGIGMSVSGWMTEFICIESRYKKKGKEVNTGCSNQQISIVGYWGSSHQGSLRDHAEHAYGVKKLGF